MTLETHILETFLLYDIAIAWCGIHLGIGLAIAAILAAGKALYRFIKRTVREHERIVNEKILRGIK